VPWNEGTFPLSFMGRMMSFDFWGWMMIWSIY
jgi:hypothetical protein